MPEPILPVVPGVAPVEAPTTPPAAQAGAPGTPPEEGKMVPLAALHESRDIIKEMRMELDTLKELQTSAFQQPMQNQPQQQQFTADFSQQQPQQQQQQPGAAQLEELWRTDPRRAIQQEMTMAFNWYDQTSGAMDQNIDALAKKNTDVEKYRTDMQKYLRKMPPQQRADPRVVTAAYYYVKGQNADNLVNLTKDELIAKIQAGESIQGLGSGGGGGIPPAPAPATGPTTAEEQMAANMGMTTEDYMKGKR